MALELNFNNPYCIRQEDLNIKFLKERYDDAREKYSKVSDLEKKPYLDLAKGLVRIKNAILAYQPKRTIDELINYVNFTYEVIYLIEETKKQEKECLRRMRLDVNF